VNGDRDGDWADDERLAADLADAVRSAERVPARFLHAGKAAFAWRTVDAELARLTFDSVAAEPATAGTRSGSGSRRTLTFVASRLTIDVEATDGALLGQVVPPEPGELELQSRDGTRHTVAVDEVGWFRIAVRPTGLFRLRLSTASGPTVNTEWIAL
jgi:hypothetical protein